ncbi:MAG: hypothetical protein F4014_12305 [Gemmatimonadetes bacterium]|nr:hypothetical protein [Gemmatimonadota bacterium]
MGSIPDKNIHALGRQLAHRQAVGFGDLWGDDVGTMIAEAFDGEHLAKPVGLGDVVANGTAWSVKTVKRREPRKTTVVRLISGRNSPDYSFGISDPRKDIQSTGRAVLAIWNNRVNASLDEFNEIRIAVLIRNFEVGEFCLFEQPIEQYPQDDYTWEVNTRGNLQGHDKRDNRHCFTWQPSGGQFTILRPVPGSARYFHFNRPIPYHSLELVLNFVGYDDSWLTIG